MKVTLILKGRDAPVETDLSDEEGVKLEFGRVSGVVHQRLLKIGTDPNSKQPVYVTSDELVAILPRSRRP